MEGKGPLEPASTTPLTEASQWTDVVQRIYQDKLQSEQASKEQASSVTDLHEQAPKPVVEENMSTNLHQFIETAKIVLERIDKPGNGYVTKQQLAQAVEDPSFTGRQAQTLAAMYANFAVLHNIGNPKGFFESDRISLADLHKLEQQNTARIQSLDELEHVQGSFAYPPDKSFSSAKIQSMLSNPNTSPQDKKSLEFLKDHFTEIAKSQQVITGDDIATYTANGIENLMDTPEGGLQISVRSYMKLVNEAQLEGVGRNLYGTDDPLSSIKPDAIRQGLVGDCYFEASLASVAVSNPSIIKDAIKDNHDGTYTVTFLGAKGDPITVAAPTDAELGLYNHASKYGVWASVMEKAYGDLLAQQDIKVYAAAGEIAPSLFQGSQATPQEIAEHDGVGGFMNQAIYTLTGNEAPYQWTPNLGQEKIRSELASAFSGSSPKAVTACCSEKGKLNSPDGFVENHAYSIVGFDPSAGNNGEVTIFNPWGARQVISLEQFAKNFNWLVIEN